MQGTGISPICFRGFDFEGFDFEGGAATRNLKSVASAEKKAGAHPRLHPLLFALRNAVQSSTYTQCIARANTNITA